MQALVHRLSNVFTGILVTLELLRAAVSATSGNDTRFSDLQANTRRGAELIAELRVCLQAFSRFSTDNCDLRPRLGRNVCSMMTAEHLALKGRGEISLSGKVGRWFGWEDMILQREDVQANLLNLLVVDDERAVREGCSEVAQNLGFTTFTADTADQAYKILEENNIDIVLLDLRLPGIGGMEALRRIKQLRPEIVAVVVTGYATVQSAVQAMKQGAYDYVTKPFNMEELTLLLERVTAHLKLASENRLLREQIKAKHGFGGLVGRAPEMDRLYRIISKAASSTHPVLILGESGTGKEVVARAIHFSGPYRDKPFIPVDCGSLVPSLIESELFGYVKGAFTGAMHAKQGLLSMAESGTVFLDEIGELPIDLQSKLLRALQEKEIRPVGGTKSIPINVRILAATNRDLEHAVQQGSFRRDLYFRLNVLTLRIPPLRERKQDIPLLVGHFLERAERTSGVQRNISDDAL